jgi:hypothetical protein
MDIVSRPLSFSLSFCTGGIDADAASSGASESAEGAQAAAGSEAAESCVMILSSTISVDLNVEEGSVFLLASLLREGMVRLGVGEVDGSADDSSCRVRIRLLLVSESKKIMYAGSMHNYARGLMDRNCNWYLDCSSRVALCHFNFCGTVCIVPPPLM